MLPEVLCAYTVKSRLRGMVLAASEMASKKAKKRNFSETEVHVLVGEIQAKQHIIFRSHGPGLTNKRKHIEWQKITAAVNQAGAAGRTVKEIRKKWTDLKREATKRIVAHRLHVADTGEGPAPPSLSSVDDIISEIIGTESTDGVMPPEEEKFGVTYTGSTQTAHEPDSENDSKEAVFAVTDPVSITTAGASAAPVRASLSFSGPAPTSVSSAQGSSSRAPTSPAGVIRDWEGVDVITDTLLQSQRETLRVQRDVAAGIGAIVQRLEAMQEAHTAAIGALTDAVRALNDTIKDFKK